MGIISTQAFQYKLIAGDDRVQLDLFQDEDIKLSNNVTGIFDIGILPSDFTRQITLPGTKKNNAFFEHVYDISIDTPFLFATNIKVPAYFDFGGIYLSNGYLQLNKVNVIANKFIDSYEVTIYGALSSFGRDVNRLYLTDLSSLSQFNHTASVENITSSWDGNLFSGSIVYPFADYGTGWKYTNNDRWTGIDDAAGAITVQDYKPAIRIKEVWDAIFTETGYTYSSSFWNQSWLDDVYMVCNYALKYPEFTEVQLEDYGVCKFGPFSGSGWTDLTLTPSTITYLPWYNVQNDPQGFLGDGVRYTIERPTKLYGEISLNVQISSSNSNVPAFTLYTVDVNTSAVSSTTSLTTINEFYDQVHLSIASGSGINRTDVVAQVFTTDVIEPGEYYFELDYGNQYSPTGGLTVKLDPGGQPKSYLQIKKVKQAGDYRIMDIPSNMPYGTTGIKLIDFISGIQKKFNLVIYPDNTKPNQFIVETFNDWYQKGDIKDFNKYINLDDSIEVIPANNFAVNKLTYGDTLDTDYVSQQFSKGANREFGKTYYIDTTNFFSQGSFDVKTSFASSPLLYVDGTGLSGSVGGITPPAPTCALYQFYAYAGGYVYWTSCSGYPQTAYVSAGQYYFINCARVGTVSGNGPATYITSCS